MWCQWCHLGFAVEIPSTIQMFLANLIDAIFEPLHKILRKHILSDEITLFIELLELFFNYQMLEMMFVKHSGPADWYR